MRGGAQLYRGKIDRARRRETTAILAIYKWTPLSAFDQLLFAKRYEQYLTDRWKDSLVLFLELLVHKCADLTAKKPPWDSQLERKKMIKWGES